MSSKSEGLSGSEPMSLKNSIGRKQVAGVSCPSHYHALTPTPMFSGIHEMAPTDADLATQALAEEGNYRFPAFDAADAVTLVSFTRAFKWRRPQPRAC